MVAQLVESGLPFAVEVYRGNLNDPPQYADFIPQLMYFLRKGSMIIMDNGDSAKSLLHEITDGGMDYLTRVRMNSSDVERIRKEMDRAEYVGLARCAFITASSHRTGTRICTSRWTGTSWAIYRRSAGRSASWRWPVMRRNTWRSRTPGKW